MTDQKCTVVRDSARECVAENLVCTVGALAVLPGKLIAHGSACSAHCSASEKSSRMVGAPTVHVRCRHFGTIVRPKCTTVHPVQNAVLSSECPEMLRFLQV